MVDCLAQTNIPHEVMSAAEAAARFPQFRFDDDMVVLYQADAGVLRASRAVQAHVRLARQYGADVRDNTPVIGIHAAERMAWRSGRRTRLLRRRNW